jgi:hypothetical protein
MSPAGDVPCVDPQFEDGSPDDEVIGKWLRRSLWVIVILAVGGGAVAGGVAWWKNRKAGATGLDPVTLAQVRERPQVEVPIVPFADTTAASGINFVHTSGAYGAKLLPETMGGGCALFDYDNDGDQDLFLVNSCHWPAHVPDDQPPPTMALYRNDGSGRFEDVTAAAGLALTFYGQGVACGDYDGDGWVDLFVTAVGPNHLLKNVQGKFLDLTAEAGLPGGPGEWSTAAAFFDYDNDDDLDLYVANYVRWTKEIDLEQDCRLTGETRAYCPPNAFAGSHGFLYRNDGGMFVDVSDAAGIRVKNPATGHPLAKSLGLAPIDIDRDGWMDLIVANDTVQNFLFHNQQDGTFVEIGALAGIAFDSSGGARGAMGIDTAYFRNNDTLGIAVANFANEMTALYCSQGSPLIFADDALATGLGPPSRLELKFGLVFFDYDLDGRIDLLTANGHIEDEINRVQSSQHYEQPPHLFWNCGPNHDTEFLPVGPEACGSEFFRPMVGRGLAYADLDGDGDLDLVLTATGGPPRVLKNAQTLGNHWLRVKLTGSGANRDAIGALVTAHVGDQFLRQQVMPTRSYLSQSELVVTFGLGKNVKVDRLVIRWPGGKDQEIVDPPIDRLLAVEKAP